MYCTYSHLTSTFYTFVYSLASVYSIYYFKNYNFEAIQTFSTSVEKHTWHQKLCDFF